MILLNQKCFTLDSVLPLGQILSPFFIWCSILFCEYFHLFNWKYWIKKLRSMAESSHLFKMNE